MKRVFCVPPINLCQSTVSLLAGHNVTFQNVTRIRGTPTAVRKVRPSFMQQYVRVLRADPLYRNSPKLDNKRGQ
jgi:hypothetical protein